MSNYRFLPCHSDHIPAVCRLPESPQTLMDMAPHAQWPLSESFMHQIALERQCPTVMVEDDQVMGYANLYNVQEGESAYLGNVILGSQVRGKGLAKLLVQYMARLAQEKCGAGFLNLSVFTHNDAAFKLYLGLGFTPWGSDIRKRADGKPRILIHLQASLPLLAPTPTMMSLDHLVLTVADLDRTVDFYHKALGMHPITFGAERRALRFGRQKINLHLSSAPFTPHAYAPTPGGADICLLTDTPLPAMQTHLQKLGITIEQGPIPRTGAHAPLCSIYFRDPDQNLVEVANVCKD
ncbi:GNAT family N-acetyltransferase [Magnetococcus sp. PR-3]|uniref:GNAT family N-acetyltransferase n=1 Tax=Magnetococcus sp. PR-3 TaxID=3120355 RepID=UPI002FCE5259